MEKVHLNERSKRFLIYFKTTFYFDRKVSGIGSFHQNGSFCRFSDLHIKLKNKLNRCWSIWSSEALPIQLLVKTTHCKDFSQVISPSPFTLTLNLKSQRKLIKLFSRIKHFHSPLPSSLSHTQKSNVKG